MPSQDDDQASRSTAERRAGQRLGGILLPETGRPGQLLSDVWLYASCEHTGHQGPTLPSDQAVFLWSTKRDDWIHACHTCVGMTYTIARSGWDRSTTRRAHSVTLAS